MIQGTILGPNRAAITPRLLKKDAGVDHLGAVVFVAAWPKEMKLPPMPKEPVTLQFTDGGIHPQFQRVIVGQELIVRIADGKAHNLVCSAAGYSDPVPLVGTPELREFKRIFTAPKSLVRLSCTVHPSDSAHVSVVPHAIVATPDRRGEYRLTHDFPPGRYTLRAVTPEYGVVDKEIVIDESTKFPLACDFPFPEE